MSDLVGNIDGHILLRRQGSVLLVNQHGALAIGYGANVLHRSGFEVGDGDHIQFVPGIVDAKVVAVPVHAILCNLESKPAQLLLVRHRARANRNTVRGALKTLKVADQNRNQVS